MSKQLIALFLFAVTLVGTGCNNTPLTMNQMADEATKELGVVVFVWSTTDDVCVMRQIKELYEEYVKTPPAQQETLREALQKYDALILHASDDAGTIQHTTYRLQLEAQICHAYGECDNKVVATRTITDAGDALAEPSSIARLPGTLLQKGAQLVLTPASARDLSLTKTFRTDNAGVYNDAGNPGSADLDTLINMRTIFPISTQKPDPINCGRLVRLKDLL